jgi:hypothetical protein
MEPLFLTIDSSIIGDWRAAQVFTACRAYAHYIAPHCEIMAEYENRQRIGWRFWMPTPATRAALLDYYQRIMAAAS